MDRAVNIFELLALNTNEPREMVMPESYCYRPLQKRERTGKEYCCFPFFEKLRYSNKRSTIFQSLYHEQKYLEKKNGKMVALQISPKIESLYGIGQTGQKIIRVCMEFCNFCKVPIWTIFHRKLLNLVRQLFVH